MDIHIKKISANPIARNILLLFSGTGISPLILFVATLFLSRIYTKSEFGDLSLIMSISGIVAAVAALRYEMVTVLQSKTSKAKTAMSLCFSLIAVVCFLVFLFLFLFKSLLAESLDISHYALLYSVPLIAGIIGVYCVFENWFNRQREYKNIVYIRIAQSATNSAAKLAFGFAGISWGLIGGTVVGYIVTILICIYLFSKKETFSCKYFSFAKMKQMAVSYQEFAKYATPSGLLNSLSLMGLPLLIAYFYSTESVGIYFFAYSTIGFPIFFISNAMSQVFTKEAAVLVGQNKRVELNDLLRKFQKSAFLILSAFLLVFSLFGAAIFSFVFGSQWYESGQLIKFFAFYVLISTTYSVISSLIDILKKQKIALIFNVSLLLSQILVFTVFSRFLNFEYTLLINSFTGCLHYFAIDRYVKNKIKIK